MIKAVIFDLDNTLYDESGYFLAVFRSFCKRRRLYMPGIGGILRSVLKSDSRDVFGDVLKKAGLYSWKFQEELFSLYRSVDTKLALYGDAADFISFAKRKGLKLGIITNGDVRAQRNKIKCLGVGKVFDRVVYARELGKLKEKPHAQAFRKALKGLNIKAREAVYVGDNFDTDIAGAKKAGIRAVLLRRNRPGGAASIKGCDVIRGLGAIKKKWS